jgi:hypothetical protein
MTSPKPRNRMMWCLGSRDPIAGGWRMGVSGPESPSGREGKVKITTVVRLSRAATTERRFKVWSESLGII